MLLFKSPPPVQDTSLKAWPSQAEEWYKGMVPFWILLFLGEGTQTYPARPGCVSLWITKVSQAVAKEQHEEEKEHQRDQHPHSNGHSWCINTVLTCGKSRRCSSRLVHEERTPKPILDIPWLIPRVRGGKETHASIQTSSTTNRPVFGVWWPRGKPQCPKWMANVCIIAQDVWLFPSTFSCPSPSQLLFTVPFPPALQPLEADNSPGDVSMSSFPGKESGCILTLCQIVHGQGQGHI